MNISAVGLTECINTVFNRVKYRFFESDKFFWTESTYSLQTGDHYSKKTEVLW